uniref:1-phosphatidylinositol 3-phosphate 5-kinase-like n=1 Tax=Erigeron canadensis TaxID=72917 RepID=UPI001CB94EE5|nr:1-phosphatidylinositol 3-phosphate 5-kinase-like [Erigeron canadensis]
MEQLSAPPPQPPPLTTVTTTDLIEDQTTNSTTAPQQQQPPSQKLRLMCSYGGHIVPRPHDKTLCYVGGDTRIVVVDRHTTLSNLINRLTKTLTRPVNTTTTSFLFTLKYQLPSEDLDSLISVTTDEDLENMIDEYERLNNINNNNNITSNRLRLYLFPVQPELVTVSSIGSLLESSTKSEDWFLNALNGTTSGFSDNSSINCLLGLEDDDVLIPEQKDVIINKSSNNNLNDTNSGKDLVSNKTLVQEVQSVPDSPMLETNSSFGSASSSPSLANLPPIRVGNVDEQPVIVGVPVGSKGVINQSQQYRFDMTSPDSVSSDGSVTNPLSRWNVIKPAVVYQDPQFSNSSSNSNLSEQSNRIQIQPPSQQQSHPQPQFVHTAVPPPQYIHHHPSGAVPVGSYYQMYTPQTQVPHPPLDQHSFVYYMPATARHPPVPAGPTQGYSLPLQTDVSPAASAPPSSQVPPPTSLFTTPRSVQAVTKTEAPVAVYRTMTSGAPTPQVVHVPSSQHQLQPPYIGYSQIHQPAPLVASSGGGSGGNYAYEFTDPSKGQHIYYAAQPLPTQSVAQYQTMTSTLPVEAQAGSHVQPDNSVKQQVRTSQP